MTRGSPATRHLLRRQRAKVIWSLRSEDDRPALGVGLLLGVGHAVYLVAGSVEQGDRASVVGQLDVLPGQLNPSRRTGSEHRAGESQRASSAASELPAPEIHRLGS